jgi:hypothetical protein
MQNWPCKDFWATALPCLADVTSQRPMCRWSEVAEDACRDFRCRPRAGRSGSPAIAARLATETRPALDLVR